MARKLHLFSNPFDVVDDSATTNDDFYGYYPYITDPTKPVPYWERWQVDNAIREGFKRSEWVYACVNRIATAAASVPWKVYRPTKDGGREPYKTGTNNSLAHPIEQLLANPNPYLDRSDYIEYTSQHLFLGGNSLSKATMMRGVPVALTPIMPDLVDVIADKTTFIARYDIWEKRDSGGKPTPAKPDEVLHIKFVDPSNFWWGISPLQAVAKTVDTDVEAVNWNKISLQNRAISDGAFVVNQALSADQYAQLRQMIREQHQGSMNAHNPWLLSFGADWKPMSMTPQELDFINSRKMNRESIIAVYNVPPPIVGLYDSATYNNIVTARKSFWLDTIIPYLDNLKSAYIFYFRKFPNFGNDWELDYDLSGVEALKMEYTERVTAARTLFTIGVPLNTLNARFELDLPVDIEFADTPFVSGVQTADSVVNVSATPPTQSVNVSAERNVSETFSLYDLETDSGRAELWKKTDIHRKKYETQLENIALKRLDEDYSYISKHFANNGAVPELTIDKWHKKMMPTASAIVMDQGTRTMNDIKRRTHSNVALDTFDDGDFTLNEQIINYLDDWFTIRAEQYNQTTLDSVSMIIAQGKEEGLNNRDIAVRIDQSGVLQENRAQTISRTEAVGLQNYSIEQSAKQSGLVDQKMWLSSRDVRVRDTHKEADGQVVSLDGQFQVDGVKMNHPGDFESSAAESINCRCTLTYVLTKTTAKSNNSHSINIPAHGTNGHKNSLAFNH